MSLTLTEAWAVIEAFKLRLPSPSDKGGYCGPNLNCSVMMIGKGSRAKIVWSWHASMIARGSNWPMVPTFEGEGQTPEAALLDMAAKIED